MTARNRDASSESPRIVKLCASRNAREAESKCQNSSSADYSCCGDSLAKIAKTAKKNQRLNFEWLYLGDLGDLGESYSSPSFSTCDSGLFGAVRPRMSLAKIAKAAKKNQRFNFEWLYLGDLGDLGESYFFRSPD
jgi:hypothetical protein